MDIKSRNENEGKGYKIEKDKSGLLRVTTEGKDGADQFVVDSARIAKDLKEPLQETLQKLFERRKKKPPILPGG